MYGVYSDSCDSTDKFTITITKNKDGEDGEDGEQVLKDQELKPIHEETLIFKYQIPLERLEDGMIYHIEIQVKIL